mgnify:CR=1 FL=1
MAKHPTKYFLDSPQLFPIQNTLLVTTSARHPHLAAIVRLSPSSRRATRCIVALLFALLLPYTLWATTTLSNSKSASTNSAIEFIHTFPTDTATPSRSASPKLNPPDVHPHLNDASTNHPTLYKNNNPSPTLQEVEKGSEPESHTDSLPLESPRLDSTLLFSDSSRPMTVSDILSLADNRTIARVSGSHSDAFITFQLKESSERGLTTATQTSIYSEEHSAHHRETIKIAFYNVENLFDTIRNPLTFDAEFTPKGARRWNTERYQLKIAHIAQVLDELQADLVGLAEVENEAVLRDLLLTMSQDYNYIHRHTADSRGIDVALLYRGSSFIPEQISQAGAPLLHRDFLVVEGELNNEPLCIVICHMPAVPNGTALRNQAAQLLNHLTDSLLNQHPNRKLIVMGDFNATPSSSIGKNIIGQHLFTPFIESEQRGFGSYCYRDRRLQYDFIMMSHNLLSEQTGRNHSSPDSLKRIDGLTFSGRYGIFVRKYMLQNEGPKRGYPFRTFDGSAYTGGYSDHLPVWVELIQSIPTPITPILNRLLNLNDTTNFNSIQQSIPIFPHKTATPPETIHEKQER